MDINPETAQHIIIYSGILLVLVQGLKNYAEKLKDWEPRWEWLGFVPKLAQKIAHGWGPVLVSVVIPLLTMLPEFVDDFSLSLGEASQLLELFGISLGANILHWILRKGPKGRLYGKEKDVQEGSAT